MLYVDWLILALCTIGCLTLFIEVNENQTKGNGSNDDTKTE